MQEEVLTRDNTHLSEPTNGRDGASTASPNAINCTLEVAEFITGSVAESTRHAYRTDLDHFICWGGGIPANADVVATYLAAHAQSLAVATLVRRLASISKAHRVQGFPSPTGSEVVRAVLRGIKRARGTAQRQAAPLLRDELGLVIDRIEDRTKDVRDRALLLIGFAAALRRSELVSLDAVDVEHVNQGIVLNIRRSKTDQEARGEKIAVPFGRTRWCPVKALDEWLTRASIKEGPIFRPIDRHGRIHRTRLSHEAVSCVVKTRLAAAGFDPAGYSGHSLRSGFATSAAQAGIASWNIRRQTRHASDQMLAKYVRLGQLFTDNPAAALL